MTRTLRGGLRHRALLVLLLLTGFATAGVITAGPASAHATVTSTDPADGSRLTASPATVTVAFSEDIGYEAGYVKVIDSKGNRVDSGSPSHPSGDGTRVTVGVKPNLPDDSYIVSYRVVSADSHPIGGAFAFVIGDGPLVSASGAVVGGTTDQVVETTFTVVRWLSFAGVVLLGGLVFVVLCWPAGRTDGRVRRIVWGGWLASTVATVLSILLEGPYGAGTGIADAVDPSLVSATLGTTFGRMLCARLVLLAVLAVLITRLLREQATQAESARARDEDIAAIVGLGILATFGGTGHAVAGSQPTLALLSDTVHLSAVSIWIGGLVVLVGCLLPSRRADELATALPIFSRTAFGAVIVLAITGTYQAWREVSPLEALWSTEYGKLLLAKIVGFVVLIGLGNLGRLAVRRRYVMPVAQALADQPPSDAAVLDPAGEQEPNQVVRRLRRSVAIEVGIATAVLALTAVLVSQAPAKASYSDPFSKTLALPGGGTVQLQVGPAKQGSNAVRVTVFDRAGKPVDAQETTLTAELPAEQIGPLPINLTKSGTGQYQASNASLPQPGTWQFVVRVRMSEFERNVAQADVKIR